jgi:hypothetical protein
MDIKYNVAILLEGIDSVHGIKWPAFVDANLLAFLAIDNMEIYKFY